MYISNYVKIYTQIIPFQRYSIRQTICNQSYDGRRALGRLHTLRWASVKLFHPTTNNWRFNTSWPRILFSNVTEHYEVICNVAGEMTASWECMIKGVHEPNWIQLKRLGESHRMSFLQITMMKWIPCHLTLDKCGQHSNTVWWQVYIQDFWVIFKTLHAWLNKDFLFKNLSQYHKDTLKKIMNIKSFVLVNGLMSLISG